MSKKVNVAIIGAGLAGLACAKELQKNKIDFHIFESTDGVGGRVRSDYVDGFTLDRLSKS
jgi:protoporphyrinogen oxidase